MPRHKKLHDKGKPISIEKSCPSPEDLKAGSTNVDPDAAARQFQLELCWCIQQLERSLSSKKNSEKQMLDSWKVLQVLKNNNQPLIRKRQLMRSHFGDYRAKMIAQERKLVKINHSTEEDWKALMRELSSPTKRYNPPNFSSTLLFEKFDNSDDYNTVLLKKVENMQQFLFQMNIKRPVEDTPFIVQSASSG